MRIPKDLDQFKCMVASAFEGCDPGIHPGASLKAHMIESNIDIPPVMDGCTPWEGMGGSWYHCESADDVFVLNTGAGRIWTVYSLSDASVTDDAIERWVGNRGLDRCWFSRDYPTSNAN